MTKNKKHILLLIIVISFCTSLKATEKIYFFNSLIEINKKGELYIEESIKIKAEAKAIKRGIKRHWPIQYKTKKGFNFKVDLEIREIRKNNQKEKYHLELKNGQRIIYIGDKNILLEPGDYTYVIRYKTNNQIGYYQDFDELYWNVNGTQWDFPIDEIQAEVRLPSSAQIKQYAAYTGSYGESGTNFSAEKLSENKIKFKTKTKQEIGENLSIAVAWQKNIVTEPNRIDKIMKLFEDNLFILIGFFGTFLSFLLHLLNWKKVGIDPKPGTIIPMFKPMDNLSPSAMRYITKMKIDDKSFTAAIISLATKGCLKIEKKKKIYHLIQEKNAQQEALSKSEISLFQALFEKASILKITNSSHKEIRNAKNKMAHQEREIHQEIYFKLNRKYLAGGILLSVLTLILMFVAIGIDWSLESLMPSFPILFFVFMMLKSINSSVKNLAAIGIGLVFICLFIFFPVVGSLGLFPAQLLSSMAIIIILLAINFLFAYLMKAPTQFGRNEMDKIEGFKMYLKTAEELRLDAQNIPNKTPQLFEKYLPYAIALDCENQWASKFENILQDAIKDGSYDRPTWYIGGSRMSILPSSFSNEIGKNLNHAIENASISPSQRGARSGGGWSGGSSGGGFSGGGGGGGGGGGW